MNATTKVPAWVWVAVGVVILLIAMQGESSTGAVVAPKGPDLLPAFRQTDRPDQARDDAVALAALCDSLADSIEYDGARGEQARLTTGAQLDNLRRWSREYMLRGESLGQRYPKLPDAIGKYLEEQLGTGGGPIDADARKRWVEAHRNLARCADWAAGQL